MKWKTDMLFEPLGSRKYVYLGSVLGGNIIGSVCYNLVLAVIMQKVLDAVGYQDSRFFFQGFAIAGISLLGALTLEPVLAQVKNHCVRRTMAGIRTELAERLAHQTCVSYERLERGDVLSRLTRDLTQMEKLYLTYLPQLGFTAVHGGMALILLFYYDGLLALLALFLGLLQLYVNRRMTARVEEEARERQKIHGALIQQVVELLDGWTDIVMSHGSGYFLKGFRIRSQELSQAEKQAEGSMRRAKTADGCFSQFNRIVIMAAGMLMVLYGRLSVGAIAAILALQGNAMYLFQNIASFSNELDNALPSIRRLQEIRQVETEKTGGEPAAEAKCKAEEPAISFQQVSFGYGEKKLLDQVSFEIPQGSFALIMGESGAGKSTLGKLILRFYEEMEGSCRIMGIEGRPETAGAIRSQIAYMDQYHKIFSMSVKENLQMVQMEKDEAELKRICRESGVDSFVSDWAEGYDYVIDDDFSNLSGGQKQRLALARMLASQRPILLIDEGTANLDEETEKLIMETLLKLRGEKTIVMVTHKPAMIPYADLVFEVKNGNIIHK